MNRRVFSAVLAGLFLCLILVLPVYSALGFGDFDSGSDFGGSDSGGYDSDSYSSSRSSRSSRSSSGGSGDTTGLFGFIVLAILFYGLLFTVSGMRNKGRKNGQGTGSGTADTHMDNRAYIAMKERDLSFTEKALYEYVRKLFGEMQDGWEKGDITNVRYGFHPDTWQRFATQLKMKNDRGETTHVRDIAFNWIRVVGFRSLPGENMDRIQVRFEAEYNVWVTDQHGKCIQGTPETRHAMTYLWTMERPDQAPAQKAPEDGAHCPNCGAELDVAAFAECPFCHTQLRQESANWVIRDIRAEAQRTI